MLKRLYIDNFKCLVNFVWQPGPARLNLLLGPNGAGKTTVFDALDSVRAFALGEGKVDALFPASSLTLWQDVLTQSFQLEWEREGSVYRYELAVEHDRDRVKRRVLHERLSLDDKPLLRFESGEVHLYRDDHSEGPLYPFDWTQSALASILPRADNRKLTWFKTLLERVAILQIVPPMIAGTSLREAQRPDRHFENFVSWYRWVSQDQGMASRLQQELQEVLPGFSNFKFEPFGPEARRLKAMFNGGSAQPVPLSFDSLSDGQKMLVALYAVLFALGAQVEAQEGGEREVAGLLCLDEPDNFIALREIQPWLLAAEDQLGRTGAQALVISHHPEIINYGLLPAPDEPASVFWFEREEGRHTRVRPLAAENDSALPPAELVARGWLK
ncbi:MAG: AAA family ATPase [Verrucomicrobia bacterium]|nr:AAA family ATPase [Verrucomicrobiota bacterium]